MMEVETPHLIITGTGRGEVGGQGREEETAETIGVGIGETEVSFETSSFQDMLKLLADDKSVSQKIVPHSNIFSSTQAT